MVKVIVWPTTYAGLLKEPDATMEPFEF